MVPLPDGWLSAREADKLAELADGGVVLELGAWKGRSTVALASTARYVVSIDAHKPFVSFLERYDEDSLPTYLDNVRKLPNVGIVIAQFSFAITFDVRAFDLVFVDGLHDKTNVTNDAMLVSRFDAVVAFHDWGKYQVEEAVRRLNLYDEPDEIVDTLAVFNRSKPPRDPSHHTT